MFRRFLNLKLIRRTYSSIAQTPQNVLEQLKQRTLVRVAGNEVSEFLQGLITNDIRHLDSGPASMYSMFLNTKGRILFDTIIYKTTENNTFFVECDKQISDTLQKHLKMHRVRRKIDISDLKDDYNLFVLFNPIDLLSKKTLNTSTIVDGAIVPCTQLSTDSHFAKICGDLIIYQDPRIVDLGSRIIAKSSVDVKGQITNITQIADNSQTKNYRWLRYKLGVGEGIEDLPPGACIALECNCDYLHGVSFHKGCYIGQELTARVHHTGVVRKRLMPINFSKIPTKLPVDDKIVHEGTNLGKLKGIERDVGLGLLRISEAISLKEIQIGNGLGTVSKPDWWPTEAPKEKLSFQRTE